jgi:two-component system NtrC family response regulator
MRQALALAGWNLSRAAELLGITRPTLYDLIEKHNIAVPERTAGG